MFGCFEKFTDFSNFIFLRAIWIEFKSHFIFWISKHFRILLKWFFYISKVAYQFLNQINWWYTMNSNLFADQISIFCFTQNMAIFCHIVEAFKYTIVGNRDTIHNKLNNLGRRSINFTHLTNTDANTLNIKQKTHFVIFKSLPSWWTNFRKKISNRNNYISL